MSELFGKLGLDWRLLLASVVNFFLLFLILRRYAFGPILRMLEKRERMVVDTVKRSEDIQAEQRTLETRKVQALKAARVAAARLVAQAAEHAEALKAHVLAETHAEVQQMVLDTQAELALEKAALTAEVRAEVADLVAAAAGKVIEQKLTAPADRRLVEHAIARVAGDPPAGRQAQR